MKIGSKVFLNSENNFALHEHLKRQKQVDLQSLLPTRIFCVGFQSADTSP